MAGLEKYNDWVEEIIKRYSSYRPSYGDVEVQVILDRENHHYQLVNVGWNKDRRIRGCVLHIDIKDNKIWIQHDGTETGVANELAEMGVPKEDIVLAFHPPYKRKYTGFAVN
ncbi:MAG: XisI protein [Desulfobacterales bacterium]|nr:XisI protein [Desulfobacterales bacterium]